MTQNKIQTHVIAITGGIASGKSTLTEHLQEMGFPVIDADAIARELTKDNSPVLNEISRKIGKRFVKDNRLDRKALGNTVFTNEKKRKQLNSLLHPMIYEQIKEKIAQYKSLDSSVVFLDIPLLFDYSFQDLVDEIWTVDVPESVQLERLMARNSLTEEEAMQRIRAQIPRSDRNKKSDIVIDNSGSIDAMLQYVDKLIFERGFSVEAPALEN